MPTYAANTTVSSEASRAEIERTVSRYGAQKFAYMSGVDQAMVAFEIGGVQVRLTMAMPSRNDPEFTLHSRGKRTPSAAAAAYEQAARQRWRALALVVKAKLEAVECGISTLEQEFMGSLVLPGGQTVYEAVMPQIEKALTDGSEFRLQIGTGRERGVG